MPARPLTDLRTSQRLARVRQHGTGPELAVRQVVSGLGHRYTVSNRNLPCSPDLANRSRGWAILVHGCFWHRHAGCRLATTPRRNRAFWVDKFDANRRRDGRVARALRSGGFRVATVWQCQLVNPDRLALRLKRFLTEKR